MPIWKMKMDVLVLLSCCIFMRKFFICTSKKRHAYLLYLTTVFLNTQNYLIIFCSNLCTWFCWGFFGVFFALQDIAVRCALSFSNLPSVFIIHGKVQMVRHICAKITFLSIMAMYYANYLLCSLHIA